MTVFIMRHAPTSSNAETPGPETIRGWGDVGLDDNGRKVAAASARSLDRTPPDLIIASDLPRAKETADVVAQRFPQAHSFATPELRTWNVGSWTGKPVDDAKPELSRLQTRNPHEAAPEGESYQDFLDRWETVVNQLRAVGQDRNVLAVVHGRQVYSLPRIVEGHRKEIPVEGPPHPGDIVAIDEDQGNVKPIYTGEEKAEVTA
ncbi:MAG TPA: histidine phosphatase family protein [Gemmatimonadales bacterium]|nr:histidine phosphatase family protein [Gemmatimonadales bacterium]